MSTAGDKAKKAARLPPIVACEGKIAFDTRELAAGVHKRCSRRKVRGRDIYRCHACRKWHMGLNSGRRGEVQRATDHRRRKQITTWGDDE